MQTKRNPAPRRMPGYRNVLKELYRHGMLSTSPRKLPPYSKKAITRLAPHYRSLGAIDLRIFTGQDAWEQAHWWSEWTSIKPILCLPPGEDPSAYRWMLVRGTEPWVIETGGTHDSILQRLALELLTAGALVVRVSFWDGSNRRMAVLTGGAHG